MLLKVISIKDDRVTVNDPIIQCISMTYDGHLANWGDSYPAVRTDMYAAADGTTPGVLGPIFAVGQNRTESGTYEIYRGFLFFDTSEIPSTAVINDASIGLFVAGIGYGNLSDYIMIKNGQPTYPRMPVQLSDFYMYRYSGNGGQIQMSQCVPGSQITIPLNSTGLSWIQKGGITKLALFSANDNNACAPAGSEVVLFYQSEAGFLYAPILQVVYTSGPLSGQIVDVKFYNPVTSSFDLSSPPTIYPGQNAGACVYFKNTSGYTINMWSKFILKRPNGSIKAQHDFSYSPIPLTNNSVASQGFAYYTDEATGQWSMDIEIYGEE